MPFDEASAISIDHAISVRRLQAYEMALFRAIRLEALASSPSAFASVLEDWLTLDDGAWSGRLKDPVFVAIKGGSPIGLMGLRRQQPRKMAHRANLVMVYVRDIYRGTGVADVLLGCVIDYAGTEKISQLELSVSADNETAIRFYARRRFLIVGCMPSALRDGSNEAAELIMVRRLGPAETPTH